MILILLKVLYEGSSLKYQTTFVNFWSIGAYEASSKLQVSVRYYLSCMKNSSVWKSHICREQQTEACLSFPRAGGNRVRARWQSSENLSEWFLTRQNGNSSSLVRSLGKNISYSIIPSPDGRIQNPGYICSSQNQNSIVVHTNPCINIGNVLDNLSF